jgi:ABC-type nickel/cobalt efflux system permease component RcnA
MVRRLASIGVIALAAVLILVALPARPAAAHPLGNFSVNEAIALDLYPQRVDVAAVIDLAELPTVQERSAVDRDGDGTVSAAESMTYNQRICAELDAALSVRADGHRLALTNRPAGFEYRPGSAGLETSRISCAFGAAADLGGSATIAVSNDYRADRIGWREMVAVGHGVHIVNSPLPARSPSDALQNYPTDLLGSPLHQTSAHLRVEPGDGPATGGAAAATTAGNPLTRWVASADRTLERMVGGHLTPIVGLLAVLLALLLGAAHAALPGHGKTVMAAYLAGRRGRPRDAVTVGATVTLTHTGGVLLLGLLLTTAASLAGERVLGWLGIASGLLVAGVGVAMLTSALHQRRHGVLHQHDHGHSHSHHHHDHSVPHHGRGHGHGDGDGHSHHDDDHDGLEAGHPHGSTGGRRRLSLVGMGIAGGLVPSPSALVILLGAIGLGRTGFGILLVLAYGVGMAGMLTAAGLVLIRLRDRWTRRSPRVLNRLGRFAPAATAALVLCVGIGLAGRAAFGVV